MKRTALKVLAVSRQSRGSTNAIVLPILLLAGIVVALALQSAHPDVSVSAFLAHVQHLHNAKVVEGGIGVFLFILLMYASPVIATRILYLVMIAAGPTIVLKMASGSASLAPFVAQAQNALHAHFGG